MTKSKTRSLNIVGILIKSIYKIVLRYLFKTDISVYNFQRPFSFVLGFKQSIWMGTS